MPTRGGLAGRGGRRAGWLSPLTLLVNAGPAIVLGPARRARTFSPKVIPMNSAYVVIDYTNHRGERSERIIAPIGSVRFSQNEWHPDQQWLLDAVDSAKQEFRSFAMKDVHSWRPASDEDLKRLLPANS